MNKNDHWKKNYEPCPSFIRKYISEDLKKLLNDYGRKVKNQVDLEKEGTEDYKKKQELYENCCSIIHCCGASSFVSGVIIALKGIVEYQIGDDRKKIDEMLDYNENVFAFNNKLYDMNICEFRNILWSDYIGTSTSYILNDSTKEDMKYVETCLRNFHSTRTDGKKDIDGDNMFKYMLYCIVASLWGDNSKYPFFHIYTGEGSNGKSYLFKLIRDVFGGYYMTLNNATVTV